MKAKKSLGQHFLKSEKALSQIVDASDPVADDIILEIDWQGAQQIREKMPESIGIFIVPPSWEVLEKRLQLRAQDKKSVIKKRMADAKAELAHYDEYDYLIVNENFSNALADLNAILRVRRLRCSIQKKELAPLLATLLS